MVFSSAAAVLLRQPALRRGAAGAASAGRATFRTSAVPRGGDHAPDYVHAKHMYDIQSVRSCGVLGVGRRVFGRGRARRARAGRPRRCGRFEARAESPVAQGRRGRGDRLRGRRRSSPARRTRASPASGRHPPLSAILRLPSAPRPRERRRTHPAQRCRAARRVDRRARRASPGSACGRSADAKPAVRTPPATCR